MHLLLEFEAGFFLLLRGAVEKCVHLWGFGVIDDLPKNIRDPCRGTSDIRGKCSKVGGREIPAELGNDFVVHEPLSNPAQGEDHECARGVSGGYEPR